MSRSTKGWIYILGQLHWLSSYASYLTQPWNLSLGEAVLCVMHGMLAAVPASTAIFGMFMPNVRVNTRQTSTNASRLVQICCLHLVHDQKMTSGSKWKPVDIDCAEDRSTLSWVVPSCNGLPQEWKKGACNNLEQPSAISPAHIHIHCCSCWQYTGSSWCFNFLEALLWNSILLTRYK